MKHILLLAAMFGLVLTSTSARMETGVDSNSGISSVAQGVEGVIMNRQKAQAKPGYKFERENSKSLRVIKVVNGQASIQTGTLTCTAQTKRVCEAYVDTDRAACSNGCYFVGFRGAPRATSN